MTDSTNAAGSGRPKYLDIENMFARHALDQNQQDASNFLRTSLTTAAKDIVQLTPAGPNQTLAIRHLEDALMRANKAISEGQ